MSKNPEEITDREQRILINKINTFVEVVALLKEQQGELSNEVFELRTVKSALVAELKKTLPSLFATMTSTLDQEIAKRIEGHFKTLSLPTLASIDRIQQKTDTLEKALDKELNKHKSILWKKGIAIYASCLLGALTMAGTLYYFFPQTKHVHHQIGFDELKNLITGKAVDDVWSKLNEDTRKMILDAYGNHFYTRFANSLKKQ
jgi:hypothetical protein